MRASLVRTIGLLAAALVVAAPAGAAQVKKPVAKKAAPAKPAAKPAAWTSVVVRTPEGGYRVGNPNAAVKLVEYGSRTCPVCGRFGRESAKPLMDYVARGKLSFEFREFLVHGQPDIAPSLLGRCGGTAKFFPILERMFAEQDAIEDKLGAAEAQALGQKMQSAKSPVEIGKAWADYLGYIPFMQKLGVSEAQSRACLANAKELDAILRTMGDAQQKLDVHSTPSFFINGKYAESAYTWDTLEPLLKAAGA